VALPLHGRSLRARSRAIKCDASACSLLSPKTIWTESLGMRHFANGSIGWGGLMGATSISTYALVDIWCRSYQKPPRSVVQAVTPLIPLSKFPGPPLIVTNLPSAVAFFAYRA
jgi:hypothetical protein